jgi:MYXO-CTERM domain-containing protein
MPGRLNKFLSQPHAARSNCLCKRLWLAVAVVSISLCAQSASANYLVSLRGPRDDGPNKVVLLGDDGHFIKDFVSAGAGGLHGPTGMAYGPDGNLYIANSSSGANNIVKFNGQTGAALGVFASSLNGPTGLRYNGNPGDPNFFTTNFGSFSGTTVSKINATTGIPANFGSGHALPTSIEVDGSGNVYVGEFGLGLVNKYNAAGTLLTQSGPVGATGGISFDPNTGQLLAADVVGDRIVTWDGANGSAPTLSLAIDENYVASVIGAPTPTNLFVGGQIYLHNSTTESLVYSTGLGIILKYTVGNPTPSTFANFFLLDPLNGVSVGDIIFTTAVPEPSSAVLALVAMAGVVAWRKRRGKALAN